MLILWNGYTNSQEILRFVISVRLLHVCTHMYMYIRNVTISDTCTVNQSVYYNIMFINYVHLYMYLENCL